MDQIIKSLAAKLNLPEAVVRAGVGILLNFIQKEAAGTQFEKAGKALHKAIVQLKAIPQPTADEAKLAKWLKYVGEEEKLFLKGAKQLKEGNKTAAQATVIRLNHNANQANNQVLAFEFKYCRFEPSKFT